MSYKDEVRLIKALADENRLAILEMLHGEEKCACVLLDELNISQPTLSHHMKLLCDSGLVDGRKEGKWMYYSLSLEGGKQLRALAEKYTIGEDESRTYKKCARCGE